MIFKILINIIDPCDLHHNKNNGLKSVDNPKSYDFHTLISRICVCECDEINPRPQYGNVFTNQAFVSLNENKMNVIYH